MITLVSPEGTESILAYRPGKAPGSDPSDRGDSSFSGSDTLNFTFGTTHDWGEHSAGDWKLIVADAASGSTGILESWSLKLSGKAFYDDAAGTGAYPVDNVYYFTDEFPSIAAGRSVVVTDTDGGLDAINASAYSGNAVINLISGAFPE